MTIATQPNTSVTLDIEDGTIVRLINDYSLTAKAGALGVVDRSLTRVDQSRYLPVSWLSGHASEEFVGGEYKTFVQMDGGYNADTFEVFEFQVGDRVRVVNSSFEFGYEGVISAIPATNGDDCEVAVDFPYLTVESMSYLFDRLEKVAFPDPLKAFRDELQRVLGGITVPQPEPEFYVGQRVNVVYGHEAWDGPATVTHVTSNTVIVETDRGETGGFTYSEVEPLRETPKLDALLAETPVWENDEEDCCASYYADEPPVDLSYEQEDFDPYADEPLAEWEKELLGINFKEGDVLVLVPGGKREGTHPDWNGLRVKLVSDQTEFLHVKPLEERPDGFDLSDFFWEREDFRAFDASDFRVGDIVESYRFGEDGQPAKAVVTRLDGEFGGDIEVNWTDGLSTLVAYGPIGARREHLTFVGVQAEEDEQIEDDPFTDLPDGTVLIVDNGELVVIHLGESA